MTRTFLTLVLTFIVLHAYAINVSGLISTNTTWTKANSPYIITGNIAVDTPATLTIEPGVVVRFDGAYKMYVYGRIMADGTASDSITFTSNKTVPKKGDWERIEILYNIVNDTLVFDYCNFKYSNDAALYVRAYSIKLTNCVFTDNKTGFINFSSPASFAYINNCSFLRNGTGIHLGGQAYIENNNVGYNDMGIYSTGPNCIVVNNKVYYNNIGIAGAIYIGGNTVAYSSSIGIDGSGMVKDNQIWYNKTGLIHRGGGLVENNGFNYNNIAINGNYSVNPGHNLTRNCIRNSASYDYVNYTIFPADISQNYWGTTDSLTISNRVFDFYDNLTSGKSAFMPPLQDKELTCLDSISLPIPITTNINETVNVIKGRIFAYPNPATNTLTIESHNGIIKDVSIYNLTGTLVLHNTANSNQLKTDVSTLSTGLYIYKTKMTDATIYTGKFMKE